LGTFRYETNLYLTQRDLRCQPDSPCKNAGQEISDPAIPLCASRYYAALDTPAWDGVISSAIAREDEG
jgi:hypothetical protein